MKTQTIEVDEATAETLKRRAAEQGLSVSDLVAGMTALADVPTTLSPGELSALDRQWDAIKAGEQTFGHADVAKWLQTWGTPGFKPRHK